MIDYKIDNLTFSSNDIIQLEKSSLLILIGPNSSGKTTALKNIELALREKKKDQLVLKDLAYTKEGSSEDFEKWLEENYPKSEINGQIRYQTKNSVIIENQIEKKWKNDQDIMNFLVHRLNTEERLQIVKPKESIPVYQENPSEYIHVLQADDKLLKKISEETKNAFNKEVIINWGGGRKVWFHVGNEPNKDDNNDRVSSKYLKELNEVPRLENEGDGIKSYIGCLLGISCGAHKILLIDEPEAFLHPSQARRLGTIIAQSAKELNRQIIIATHSGDIIKGAFNAGEKVSVCRIERNSNDENTASLLGSSQLKDLWSKPLLQSTSAINGVFHTGVVVCEADADCRFFERIIGNIDNKNLLDSSPDLYFIHGGGKGEISTLVNSYRTLNIKTAAIVDFDILRNTKEFKKLYGILGGKWEDIESKYNNAKAALDELPSSKTIPEFVKEMNNIVKDIKEKSDITNSNKQRISNLLSDASKWSEAKKHGINKLNGGAYRDCETVIKKSHEIGLFIIPNGELESWWRAGPSNKSEWIIEALEKLHRDDSEFVDAEDFMISLCEFFGLKKK